MYLFLIQNILYNIACVHIQKCIGKMLEIITINLFNLII